MLRVNDTKRFNEYQDGSATIFAVIATFVFLVFFVLAVDVAYVYCVRGQLQNAADAACIAASSKVDRERAPAVSTQTAATQEAKALASENIAAGSPVKLIDTDIVYGSWDGLTRVFTPGAGPTNALSVTAQRTFEAPDGGFDMFFPDIIGIDELAVSTTATCVVPDAVESPIALCEDTMNDVPMNPNGVLTGGPSVFYWAPYSQEVDPGTYGVAWTLFDSLNKNTPASELRQYFCEGNSRTGCANDTVYADNGYKNSVARNFRCAFYNPDYDEEHKKTVGGMVTEWTVLVPVFESMGCPPGAQPLPYRVVNYAWVTLTEVWASWDSAPPECSCETLEDDHPAIYESIVTTGGGTPNGIEIKAIEYPATTGAEGCLTASANGIGRLVQ
jgi:Flp pilus assembly protein TadG